MLAAEKARCGSTSAMKSMVTSAPFHSALLACCFTLVIEAYRVNSLRFPAILDLFNVSAWELLKVMESFVKHLDSSVKATHVLNPHMSATVAASLGQLSHTHPAAVASGQPVPVREAAPLPRSIKQHLKVRVCSLFFVV